MTPERSGPRRRMLSLVILLLSAAMAAGCGWFGGTPRPQWIEGTNETYPHGQYLLGVGQADSRAQADERAYAALSKIFKAEITAQAKDWESYVLVETQDRPRTQHRLTLDQVTNVTTDKVLENVRILDGWFDRKARQYYALAGMPRAQAETAMLERLAELDRTIHTEVDEARRTTDILSRVRNLKRATRNLVLREAYNTDLRIIRPSGQGTMAAYRAAELSAELEQVLATQFGVAVSLSGEQAEPVMRALVDGLTREGLTVVSPGAQTANVTPALVLTGTVRVRPMDVRDPRFRYVRWCADVTMTEQAGRRVVGALSKGGKEGHLTEREATAKAVRVMQQEFAADVARSVAAHVYGEAEWTATETASSGCPKDAEPAPPLRAPM